MPLNMTFEEAATVPTVFITAHSAFQHAINLQPSDRVLVHAAAGQPLSTTQYYMIQNPVCDLVGHAHLLHHAP